MVARWIAVIAALAAFGLGAGTAAAQQYDWTNDVPPMLEGTWVKMDQRCEDSNSQLMIFSDGGYRWRKSRTDWGFARGKFAQSTPASPQVYFRLQRFIQQDHPDFQINVSGMELRKYSFGSGKQVEYVKCPNGAATN